MKKQTILIHAKNVTGLGATQVVGSLIKALLNQDLEKQIFFALPLQGDLSKLNIEKKFFIKSILPNALFRVVECLFPRCFYPSMESNLILGDIPLRGLKNQVVLVHQSNLIKPSVNVNSSDSVTFKIMRKIFEWNLKDVKYIVVQSDVMKNELMQSYPILDDRIAVVPQPSPDWFLKPESSRPIHKGDLRLFYPAASYPHKNHDLIGKLDMKFSELGFVKEIIVTLQDNQVMGCSSENSKVQNVGRLSPQECMDYYKSVDALFFPSLAESYGLPLVEAMISGLPILCSDLPYARWMCEDKAIYFDPMSVESANEAINELQKRLEKGWLPDWSKALSKLPNDWDSVVKDFIELLK